MFNELLEEAGEFGRYQKCLIIHLILTMVYFTSASFVQIFILMVPPHRCKTHENDTYYNAELTDGELDQCKSKTFISSERQITNVTEVQMQSFPCTLGYVYDFSKMFPTFATEHNLVCGDSWKMYCVHACYYAGAAIGALFAGMIADKYGRKKSYQICNIFGIVFDIATLFAPNTTILSMIRFFSNMGTSNLTSLSFVLVTEYTGPKYRLINLTFWASSYIFGATLLPWIAHAINDWRYLLALTLIPSISALIASIFIPESASWLMTNGRWDEAAKLIHEVSKVNGRELSLSYIKSKLEMQDKQEITKELDTRKHGENTVKRTALVQSILDLFGTPKRRKTTLTLCSLWMIATLCYVGNSLQTSNLPYVWYINFSIGGISELPIVLFNLLLLDKIGRRWSNVCFFTIGSALAIIAGTTNISHITVFVFSMIVRLCFATAYDVSFMLASESFPTVVRGRGVLLARGCGSIANALSPFVVYLSEIEKLLPLTVLGLIATFGVILTLLLAETAGQHLPHTLDDGEKFGENQQFCFCPCLHKIEDEDVPVDEEIEMKSLH